MSLEDDLSLIAERTGSDQFRALTDPESSTFHPSYLVMVPKVAETLRMPRPIISPDASVIDTVAVQEAQQSHFPNHEIVIRESPELRIPYEEWKAHLIAMQACPHWERSPTCCGPNVCKQGKGRTQGEVNPLDCYFCLSGPTS